jgi:hypothetical protein
VFVLVGDAGADGGERGAERDAGERAGRFYVFGASRERPTVTVEA